MRNLKLPVFLIFVFSLAGCLQKYDCVKQIGAMTRELGNGNVTDVRLLALNVKRSCSKDDMILRTSDSLVQIADRIVLDFSVSEGQVKDKLLKSFPNIQEDEIVEWEKKGWLEYRLIDGKKMYFKRAVSNLLLLKKFYEDKDQLAKDMAADSELIFRLRHTEKAWRLSDSTTTPVAPVKFGITYTLTVNPDVVPDGETIRCWLPYPKAGQIRQNEIELLSTSSPEYSISPDSATHSCIYLETRARRGSPTVFRISYRFQSAAQHFNLSESKILPYIRESDIFKKYTSEQPPQIIFSPEVRRLADSITGNETDPVMIVRKIYMWFKENIPWTGALEYSTMADIPGYVLHHRRGDCGMQTFLYISMLRYKGIPAKWQSGWMLPPGAENLHDWCEIYFEGTGWVPSDITYDLQNSPDREIKEYFMSGIDAYRLIVNEGVSGNLYPHKKFLRSEPYDFQRGEVEWKGGNLYFNYWDYEMDIQYLP